MKNLLLIFLLFLSGCITCKEIKLNNVQSLNPQVYQISGYYEVDEDNFTKRIILSRGWIKKINKNKFYYEIIFKEPIAERKELKKWRQGTVREYGIPE